MAGERKITVAFDGKDVGLGTTVDRVTSDLDGLERSGRSAADSFGALGEGADTGEQRLIGVADSITGTQDVLQGFSDFNKGDMVGGLLTMTMGFADLASGVSNLIAPFASQVAAWVTGRTTMAAADVAGATAHNTSWISMAAASTLGAAKVALSWLIAVGPVLIVIAIIVGLVVVIVKNWDTIKRVIAAGWEWVRSTTLSIWNGIVGVIRTVIGTVQSVIQNHINMVLGVFRALPGGLRSALSTVADAITAPFRVGFNAIKGIWNRSVGGKGFSVPSWVPGVGGKEFRIPMLHSGGVFRSNMLGGEGLALLRDGERVLTPGQALGGGGGQMVHVQVMLEGQVLVDVVRKAVRTGGGLQVVLGP